jgi:hypothetical protein
MKEKTQAAHKAVPIAISSSLKVLPIRQPGRESNGVFN